MSDRLITRFPVELGGEVPDRSCIARGAAPAPRRIAVFDLDGTLTHGISFSPSSPRRRADSVRPGGCARRSCRS